MSDILVRGVNPEMIENLKRKARARGRSLQTELKEIIDEAGGRADRLSELEVIRRIREGNTCVNMSDSVDLLREDRER